MNSEYYISQLSHIIGNSIFSVKYESCQLSIIGQDDWGLNIEGFWRIYSQGSFIITSDTILSIQHEKGKLEKENEVLSNSLKTKVISDAKIDFKTGDLIIYFEGDTELHVMTSHTFYQTWIMDLKDTSITSDPGRGIT